jgi:hypothetical protein
VNSVVGYSANSQTTVLEAGGRGNLGNFTVLQPITLLGITVNIYSDFINSQ